MKTKLQKNYICHKNSDGKLRYFSDGSILEIVSSNRIILRLSVMVNSYMDENNGLNQNNGQRWQR